MDKINVLVTSAGGFGHGSSIVKALLRSSLPLNVIGTDMSPRLINSSELSSKEVVPPANADGYIEAILGLIKSYSIDCMFTGSEQELLKASQCRGEIESSGVKLFLNNTNVINLCKNKLKCNERLAGLGFSAPKTILIGKEEDCDRVDFYPAVIKPYLETGASVNIFIANNKDELKLVVTYLLARKLDVVAQEYLPYKDNEYTVGVTSLLEKAQIVSSIAMRRFVEGPSRYIKMEDIVISSGLSQGEFLGFDDIRSVCEEIAVKIGSTGPMNIQLRVVNGKVRPFEINPRFSGTTSARALNGYNEPEFFIRKYIVRDPNAADSLVNTNKGFVVKSLNEKYFKHE